MGWRSCVDFHGESYLPFMESEVDSPFISVVHSFLLNKIVNYKKVD